MARQIGDVIVDLQNISLRFGGVKALTDISFNVREHEIRSIIGPNGAGKSSMLNVINGVYHPQEGQIFFRGRLRKKMEPHQAAEQGIARTFQNIPLFNDMTALDNIMTGHHIRSRANPADLLAGTARFRRAERQARERAHELLAWLRLDHKLGERADNLSYGEQRRLELARALCTEPKLLLLDEPSSGLNVEETDDMAFWIQDIQRDLGITVLMVEHDMGLVSKVSDRVLAMNQGEVLALGTPAEVQSQPGRDRGLPGRRRG